MSKDPRKDELKKMWREQEHQKLIASIPMSLQDLRALFDYLDDEGAEECDHTLRVTTEFLQQRGLDIERIIPWLREHGGSCDCEVLSNVEDDFSEILEG
ncbi:MAG TPA: DUF2695 domain-containing protein [Thermoanaerobaculia bacterium]|nr:DUF2695 domain-containing protein [Thermoanaerobaculia bacterium]